MELDRKALLWLKDWKLRDGHKSLLMMGTHKTGRTWICQKHGESYESYIQVDFLKHPELKVIFDGSLQTTQLKQLISLYIPDANLIPGNTLLILNEIQECPRALTSLKSWTQDPEIDVIGICSFQRPNYNSHEAFPVGNVEFYRMTGLDFEEFAWAVGIDKSVTDSIRNSLQNRTSIHPAIHNKMLDVFQEYIICGGMPEAVCTWLETKSIEKLDEVQKALYEGYVVDIVRFAPSTMKRKVELCWKFIPDQLLKTNHKFQYSHVQKGGNKARFGTSLDWLEKSMFTFPVRNLKTIAFPLSSVMEPDHFREYMSDLSLFISSFPAAFKSSILKDKEMDKVPSSLELKTAKGGLYEALAAEMLYKAGYENLYFFAPRNRDMEIEFVIETRQGILPIEVKAGRNRSRSLDTLLKEYPDLQGIKAGSYNIGTAGNKITIPLYALAFL